MKTQAQLAKNQHRLATARKKVKKTQAQLAEKQRRLAILQAFREYAIQLKEIHRHRTQEAEGKNGQHVKTKEERPPPYAPEPLLFQNERM